ncbi:MAG: hypothetical protein EPN43_05655 [Jatrophihabitans sp.]|nr:MAG: hypothetical protein EPN43_05655 [Jatrophihabitans sp.]
MTRAGCGGGDRGSASLWIVAACLVLLLAGTVVTVRAAAVAARHRVETAADLAALAAAGRIGTGGQPCGAAREIAVRNGARLVACATDLAADGRSGTVEVRAEVSLHLPLLGDRIASAAARAQRSRSGPSTG